MGDEAARNRLIESNLRFVLKVVYEYWRPGLPLMDMASGGCQGLIKAAKTFDPDKGFRFLTYARSSIAQGVIGAMNDHKQYKHESLDELIYDDESETSEKDLLVSKDPQGEEVAFYNQVRDLLNHLDDRERTIIILRFWHSLTLEEVSLRIHITKETVRRIESRALRKLRWAIDAKDRETEERCKSLEISGFPGRKV
ncbi:MAG: RNA polymerase sporulation specific sigma factor SigK [Candidatus Jettenia ecosi]|uniref:RNA polymerase sporulation specific sigma factor SigK n=1 Tax=Candidatus Jettenia ecosi TaxID=2494326 RepID=A0A533Q7K4_9BACT|nr:MAG: RNA polymerase sporulation specific sigma factor SigK [Candidatus Jettenia ecosi]